MSLLSPTFVDLFCGAGGFSIGFKEAGFTLLSSIDCWDKAVEAHQQGLPGSPCTQAFLDKDSDVPRCDVLVASPPCQPYSRTGRQKGNSDERDGFPTLLSIVARNKPPVVVVENVANLAGPKHSDTLNGIVNRFKDLGYNVHHKVVDAAKHGVPQHRKRLFLVCVLKGSPAIKRDFHWPTELPPTCVRDVLPDLETRPLMADEHRLVLNEQTMLRIQKYEAASHCKNPRDIAMDKPLRTMTCRNIAGLTNDTIRVRLRPEPSVIGMQESGGAQRRMLTIREAAQLQTFPANYFDSFPRPVAAKLIGNAVPPKLGKEMATSILSLFTAA